MQQLWERNALRTAAAVQLPAPAPDPAHCIPFILLQLLLCYVAIGSWFSREYRHLRYANWDAVLTFYQKMKKDLGIKKLHQCMQISSLCALVNNEGGNAVAEAWIGKLATAQFATTLASGASWALLTDALLWSTGTAVSHPRNSPPRRAMASGASWALLTDALLWSTGTAVSHPRNSPPRRAMASGASWALLMDALL